jgi:Sulfotransferase domain/Sulfotransferase family
VNNLLFITGYPRSGTTLLEKILHNHEDISIGSQPFPVVYYKIKEAFYANKGIKPPVFPLGHLFVERHYKIEEFTGFLAKFEIPKALIKRAFIDMEGYGGQKTPIRYEHLTNVKPGKFINVYKQLINIVAAMYGKANSGCKGSKEAFCEEFVPAFLSANVKVIVIIRDPRDVLTSINFGRGAEFAGRTLPTLYILRNWRKSVAISLVYNRHSNFMLIRYEDLVNNYMKVLKRLTDFIKVSPYSGEEFNNGILDQDGNVWSANSSFGQQNFISNASIGRYKTLLSEETIRYVESICYTELQAMGYEITACKEGIDEPAIRKFREPFKIYRKELPIGYSSDNVQIENEIQRIRMFNMRPSTEEKRLWFIFPEIYDIYANLMKK